MTRELWYTAGPSSEGLDEEMLRLGATGLRLTFSFGVPEIHHRRARAAREAAHRLGTPCLIVADLPGEKFRIGRFATDPSIRLDGGDDLSLIWSDRPYRGGRPIELPVPDAAFFRAAPPGTVIVVGDGSATLRVVRARPERLAVQVVDAGTINQGRGLTIQGTSFRPRCLTGKDWAVLEELVRHPIYDAVALSFVSGPEEIRDVRSFLHKNDSPLKIIAKIESAAALDRIEEICGAADWVMAARGDLALAIPWWRLAPAVGQIARAAVRLNTPWILATQIVEGVERYAFPTRAEICDLSHWIEEGCHGVLLSHETTFGTRPEAAVRCAATLLLGVCQGRETSLEPPADSPPALVMAY